MVSTVHAKYRKAVERDANVEMDEKPRKRMPGRLTRLQSGYISMMLMLAQQS